MLMSGRPVEPDLNGFFGMPIVCSPLLVEMVQYSRSPGRAARRARMGYRQHFTNRPMRKAFKLPDGTIAMHPAMYEAVRQRLSRHGP